MLSYRNELFELAKIKIEIEFINKVKYSDRFEKLKKLVKDQLSEVDIQVILDSEVYKKSFPSTNIMINRYLFFKIYENNDLKNKLESSHQSQNSDHNLKFYISVFDNERKDKLINMFRNHINSINSEPFRKDLYTLLFLQDSLINETDNRIIDDNIIYIESERANPDFFFQTLKDLFLKKIEILIKSFVKEAENQIISRPDEDEQSKRLKLSINLKNKADKCILLGDYRQSSLLYNSLIEIGKQNSDNILIAKCFEGVAISFFLMDYSYSRRNPEFKLKFNNEIESNLNNSAEKFKKVKIIECHIDILFKMVYYYLLFDVKLKNFFDYIKRIVDESEQSNSFFKFNCLLKIYYIFNSINFRRKASFYLYLALNICLENPDLTNIVPFVINELQDKYNVYDILKMKLNSAEEFLIHHKELKRNDWKKISFNTYSQNMVFIKTIYKKRVDKGHKLIVKNRLNTLRPYILLPVWENIQNYLIKQIIFFYSKQSISKQISFSLSQLQTLCNFLSDSEQKQIMSTTMLGSLNMQEKFFGNLIKSPLLIKIEPMQNEIRFETSVFNKFLKSFQIKNNLSQNKNSNSEETEEKRDSIFLYNPWDKNETCYFWTVNSIQNIIVHLYNPLNTDLVIQKLVIFCEGSKPFGFPVSSTITSKSYQSVICKVKPLEVGLTDIIGIRYEVSNLGAVQYVDINGNGLLYNLEKFGSNKGQKIKMKNIQIYPEIPMIKAKINNLSEQNESLELVDYQNFNFEIFIENIGNYKIKSISLFVYAYKNEEFKSTLNEVNFENESGDALIEKFKNFTFIYSYLHNKKIKKLEFKLVYKAFTNDLQIEQEININPYYNLSVKLKTSKLFELTNLKVIPVISDNAIQEIANLDSRINKNYKKYFGNEKYIVSFLVSNLNDNAIFFEILWKENLIKQEICEEKYSKEISFVINKELNFTEFFICWSIGFTKQLNGKMDMIRIFKEFSFHFKDSIKFEIDSKLIQEDSDFIIPYFLVTYKITNNSQKSLKNLKFHIYLFQRPENNLIFNKQLNENIFYEGSLDHQISDFNEKEAIFYKIKVFPQEMEHVFTCCLVIDINNHIIHMSPFSKTLYLE